MSLHFEFESKQSVSFSLAVICTLNITDLTPKADHILLDAPIFRDFNVDIIDRKGGQGFVSGRFKS